MKILKRLVKSQDPLIQNETLISISEFTPENELEEVLRAVATGEKTTPVFFDRLLHSKLFVPSSHEAVTSQNGKLSQFRPILFLHPNHGRMVAVFTSQYRTRAAQKHFPLFRSGILTEATLVLKMVPSDTGLCINPGWKVGLEMPAEELMQFKRDLGLVGPRK